MFTSAKKSFSIFCLLFWCHQTFAADYRQVFGAPYIRAEKTAAKISLLIKKYAGAYGESSRMMEAIVFPEIIRYNRMYDVVETGSIISMYTRFGPDYADFSIGILQMKPTFATSVEKEVARYEKQKWVKELGFADILPADNYDNRMDRVKRLLNTEWQVKYLLAMLKCIRLKHDLSKLSESQRVLFLASAYNCGWNKSAAVIRSFISKKFYKTSRWDDTAYAFADVALFRYKELSEQIAESSI